MFFVMIFVLFVDVILGCDQTVSRSAVRGMQRIEENR